MSLKFNILDDRNTSTIVNIGEFKFYSGEDRTLRVQIVDDIDDQPRYIAAGGTIQFTISASPTDLSLAGTIDTNRSIVTLDFSQANTTAMTSGNLVAEIDEAGSKRTVKSSFVMRKLPKTSD